MSAPSPQSILRLYSNMLRTANSFSSYNFRNYFLRRTRLSFRDIQAESDPAKLREKFMEARNDYAVLQRSAVVNQLYGGWKLAVERPASKPQEALTSGNN